MLENTHKEILLIDKSKGITSFDVIRELRNILGIKKMGHAGTLDPLATGLLIVGVEGGTKKMEEYLGLDKVYEAEVLIGEKRTTGDMEGEVIDKKDVSCEYVEEKIESVLSSLVGEVELSVPIYSAIKVDGKPLYWYARNNKEVEVPKKIMRILDISYGGITKHERGCVITFSIHVGSGAYIRSIAEEIGERLGLPAVLFGLRRTRIGDFDIKDASTLEELKKAL